MSEPPAAPIVPAAVPALSPVRAGFWVRIAFGLMLLLFAGAPVYIRGQESESTNDAYVTGHVHVVAPRVAGTIVQVLVDDNQHVGSGQVLALLDARDFQVRDELARAQIAQAQAQRLASDAQIREAEARIASARSNFRKAELDFARDDEMIQGTPLGISRRDFDVPEAARDAARAALDSATAQLTAARANRAATVAAEDTGRASASSCGSGSSACW
jgi:membrane fusion protein (multidrug efflux system)